MMVSGLVGSKLDVASGEILGLEISSDGGGRDSS